METQFQSGLGWIPLEQTYKFPELYWWIQHLQDGNASLYAANRSVDVLCANCINPEDVTACLRAGVVALLSLFGAMVAFTRIVRLHATQPSFVRLILYYVLCVHCIVGSLEWLLGWNTKVSLSMAYAKAIELVVISYFYLDIASKMMHWSSVTGRRLCFLGIFLMFTYFTAFLVLGMLLSIEPWTDCHAIYWVYFSVGEVVIVQLMVVSFWLIWKRMRRISAEPNVLRSQKNDLWILFLIFEGSAAADLALHWSYYILADDERGCSGIFNNDQMLYSVVKTGYDLVSFLLPVAAILYVFRTTAKPEDIDFPDTEFSSHGSSRRNSFSNVAEIVVIRNFRRRYRPLTQPSMSERPVLPGQPRQGGLRAVASTPAIAAARRTSVSRSLVSSPLYSIPEERINTMQAQLAREHAENVEMDKDEHDSAGSESSLDALSTAPLLDDDENTEQLN